MIVKPGSRHRTLVVALAAIYGMGSQWAHANPTGAQVVHGQAAVQTQGNRLTVTNTPGAIINWQSFSIGAGETTYFQQQNAASAVLNRVQMQNPALKSQIDGTLGSNGRVFLINPNGIVFGPNSLIDTQGFVASTLGLNDEDFKQGRFRFARQGAAGDIQAQGRISSGSGDVYLVAPNIGVDGNAVISSQGGNIVLAAGEMVEITGRNLNDITFAIQSKDNQAINLGTLSGGAVGVFAGTLNHSGVIQAQTLASEGGRLVLKALGNATLGAGSKTQADGQTLGGNIAISSQSGNIVVDTGALVSAQALAAAVPSQAAPRGGSVGISATNGFVALERGSLLSADGGRGGNITVQADRLFQDGAVRADGHASVGGSVVLQADTRMIQTAGAVVSAQGVANGGQITLSVDTSAGGEGLLFTSATLDASASTGVGGSITVAGRDLTLAAAHLQANGDAGGGRVRVGGGRAGADSSMVNAQNIVANAATRLTASARVDGDGGSVVAWADGTNQFAGNLEARGGAQGGNGGFIEVSGKQATQFGGMANAGAPHGSNGTFLIDPKFILIQAASLAPGVTVELLDPNPNAGDLFGNQAQVLSPTGNILILNPNDDFAATNAGAIYLYDGLTGGLLSSLRGSASGDQVGNSGVFRTLSGGDVMVRSSLWNSSAGALTTISATTGSSGTVSSANSLVGAAAGDQIGSGGSTTLSSGKVVIFSPNWNGAAGAITWADGTSGIAGTVSSGNSLVGAAANDRVGNNSINSLGSGKYYVNTSAWNGSAGAITWIDSAAPLVGVVGSGNSLVGGTAGDQIGSGGIQSQSNGKSLVFSPGWNGSMGAVTLFDKASGTTGVVGAGNSLVGSTAGDLVGSGGAVNLFNGKAIVFSPDWNGSMGAVTWFDNVAGTFAAVDSTNSLVGSTGGGASLGDRIGSGSYINFGSTIAIRSPNYNNGGATKAGAITYADPLAGVTGLVSVGNSLLGSNNNDRVGNTSVQSTGSNYYWYTPTWNGNAGAITFFNPSAPVMGAISGSNSLVGASANDQIGSGGVRDLFNGYSLIFSPSWDNGGFTDAGAVTWYNQATGTMGVVGAGNSLVGSFSNAQVGGFGDYNYVGSKLAIFSPNWNTSSTSAVGAITWADPGTPLIGAVSPGNSLVGTFTNDRVGDNGLAYLDGTHYAVVTPTFNSNTGAVTWIDSASPRIGTIGSANSLVGSVSGDQVGSGGLENLNNGQSMVFSPNWNGARGAVTWFSHASGRTGNVDSINSLVGVTAGDRVGSGYWDYVGSKLAIFSPDWNNGGTAALAGAVTWADPLTGVAGDVSASNSLVGSHASDRVGNNYINYLDGTHYAVLTQAWNSNMGAVTWIDSAAPTTGAIDSTNSLVGAVSGDAIGSHGFANVASGKSIVLSPGWNGNMGAVTWFDYAAGTFGTVDATNSLVGSTGGTTATGDRVGGSSYSFVGSKLALRTPNWNNGPATLAGAVTFVDPSVGITGAVSAANSLVGTHSNDRVGNSSIQFLTGSQYYLTTSAWNSSAGAVTFINSTAPSLVGAVSSSNSLVGSGANDRVGNGGVQNVGSGNYLVFSPNWNGDMGAVTWLNGAAGIAGTVSGSNSLVGSTAGDQVGSGYYDFVGSKIALFSPNWNNNGTAAAAGAVTWMPMGSAMTGTVTASNSLVGSNANDRVGSGGFTCFSCTYEILRSSNWNGNRGAVTWIDPNAPLIGVLSASNSLVGANANDFIGSSGVSFLSNGDYYVRSPSFNGSAGAVTIGSYLGGISGVVSSANSLVGQVASDGYGSTSPTQLTGNRLLVRAPNADGSGLVNSGRVHIYSGGSGGADGATGQTYSSGPGSSVTITTNQITAITNTGTDVVLQANTDITLAAQSDIVTNNPSGLGGDITLQAGRSIFLNSSIATDDGDLTLIANDRVANGVSAADRDAGTAGITMAEGTLLDAGAGRVEIFLADGLGHAGASSANGTISLRSIKAHSLLVMTDAGGIQVGDAAATAASSIQITDTAELVAATTILFAGGAPGAFAELSAFGQITIDPPSLEMRNGASYARITNPTLTFPIKLEVSNCISCVFVSPYEITGIGSGTEVVAQITASLLSLNPNMLDQIPDTKESKGEIEIEVEETCK